MHLVGIIIRIGLYNDARSSEWQRKINIIYKFMEN